jgi:hypothetical protein
MCHKRRCSVIVTGEQVVSFVSIGTTAVLSPYSMTFRPREEGLDSEAHGSKLLPRDVLLTVVVVPRTKSLKRGALVMNGVKRGMHGSIRKIL